MLVGTEHEFDFITRVQNKYIINRSGQYTLNKYFIEPSLNWGKQHDATVGAEINTRPFSNISNYLEESEIQWRAWTVHNSSGDFSTVPLMVGGSSEYGGSFSVGNHIHLGREDDSLSIREKDNITRVIYPIYPLLIFIGANDYRYGYRSYRGLKSDYCIASSDHQYPLQDTHYGEFSNSSHGTLEFRIFDANIPQVIATNMLLIKKIGEWALEKTYELEKEQFESLKNLRYKVLRGKAGVTSMSECLHQLCQIHDLDLTNLPKAVRQVLNLAFEKQSNAGQYLWNFLKSKNFASVYEFFSNALQETSALPFDSGDYSKYSKLSDYFPLFRIRFVQGNRVTWLKVFRFVFDQYSVLSNRETVLKALVEGGVPENRAVHFLDMFENGHRIPLSEFSSWAGEFKRNFGTKTTLTYISKIRKDATNVLKKLRHEIAKMKALELAKVQRYSFFRLYYMPEKSRFQVSKQISEALRETFNITMYPTDVIYAKERYYVASVLVDGEEIMLAFLGIMYRTGEVLYLYTSPQFRRLGVASRLLKVVLEEFRTDLQYLKLTFNTNNITMLDIAKRFNAEIQEDPLTNTYHAKIKTGFY